MNKRLIFKWSAFLALLLIFFTACKEEEYSLGTLTAPTNLVINTSVAGQSTANPTGDGSGVVTITAHADNALNYGISITEVGDMSATNSYSEMPGGTATHKFTKPGEVTYRISVIAYGAGGTTTVGTKDVTVKSVYDIDPAIVKALTNNASKTWKIDRTVAGHMGVGPWAGSYTPEWWTAGVNEKKDYPCFYNATYTFTRVSTNNYTITSTTPDGIYTKTGALAGVPGIPASGGENCYAYGGATSAFTFASASSGAPASVSTQASIVLAGNSSFIGYGATQKEYEILSITDTALYLRVRGTETGNAWYLKLVPAL